MRLSHRLLGAINDDAACPGTDELAQVIEGTASEELVGYVLRHVRACPECEMVIGEACQPGIVDRAHAPDDPLVGANVGRYQVRQWLGAGMSALVYRAHDPHLEREVALKLLREPDSALRAAFVAEGRALARIDHPNVVPVFDAGELDGEAYLALGYMRGGSLIDWQRTAPRGWSAKLDIIRAAATGLAAIHDAGLVHRDIKPANILIDAATVARVGDLGLAAAAQPSKVTGVGTVRYWAPELARGSAPTARSDQYAICLVAIELLLDGLPVAPTRDSTRAMLERAGVPRSIARALVRGVAKDPRQRFSSVADLCSALERAQVTRSRTLRRVALATSASVAVFSLLAWNARTQAPEPCDAPYDDPRIERLPVDSVAGRQARALGAAMREALDSACQAVALTPTAAAYLSLGCVERKQLELDQALTLLNDEVERPAGLSALFALRSPLGCLEPPESMPIPPEDIAADVVRAQLDLRRARVHAEMREFADAQGVVEELLSRESVQRFAPLHAEVELLRGRLLGALGDDRSADVVILAAADEAERAGAAEVRFEALASWLARSTPQEGDSGFRKAVRAEVDALLRYFDDPWMRAIMAMNLGSSALRRREGVDAERWFALGVDELVEVVADDHPLLATMRVHLGSAKATRGAFEEAVALQHAGLERLTAALGPDHPDVLMSKAALVYSELGRGDAEAAFLHIAAVEQGLLARPRRNPADLLHAAVDLCYSAAAAGHHEIAQQACGRALALGESRPARADLAWAIRTHGAALQLAGRDELALEAFERARAIDAYEHDDERVELDWLTAVSLARLGRHPAVVEKLAEAVRVQWRGRGDREAELATLEAALAGA